jgi:hypothetical protein
MKVRSLLRILIFGLIFCITGCSNHDNKQLPRVLVIGDSISIGYTPFVMESLKNIAEVSHIEGNAENSDNGVKNLQGWIGNVPWHVIVFNFGLWDICYRNSKPFSEDNRDKVNGAQAVPISRYRENLELITLALKATGAKLIYINTTVVPIDEPGRFIEDVAKYNQAARQIMQKEEVKIVDLQEVSSSFIGTLYSAPKDVHYTPEGYRRLAEPVTQAIRSALH